MRDTAKQLKLAKANESQATFSKTRAGTIRADFQNGERVYFTPSQITQTTADESPLEFKWPDDRQRELSRDNLQRATERYLDKYERMLAAGLACHWDTAQEYIAVASGLLRERVERECSNARSRSEYVKHLRQFDAGELAIITTLRAFGRCLAEPGGVAFTELGRQIGNEAYQRHISSMIFTLARKGHDDAKRMKRAMTRDPMTIVFEAKRAAAAAGIDEWPEHIRIMIGVTLIQWLILSCDNGGEPWFLACMVPDEKGINPAKSIALDTDIISTINGQFAFADTVTPIHSPMVVTPGKWRDGDSPFPHSVDTIITKASSRQREIVVPDIYLRGLDTLAETRWTIDPTVLSYAMKYVEGSADLVNAANKMCFRGCPPTPPEGDIKAEFHNRNPRWWSKRWRQYANECAEHARRVRAVADAKTFATDHGFNVAHRMDFRGRTFPMSSGMNHHRDDLYRGMMVFQEAKPLDERGVYWLKVHAANCFGLDKRTYADRVKYIDGAIERIPSAYDFNPAAAESPFQFVAVFGELMNLFDASPSQTQTRVPVGLDCTSSGLQHFAALARDGYGGRLVNLCSGDTREDIYQHIANHVAGSLRRDGDGVARLIVEHIEINRALMKKPVMTFSYNISRDGMTRDIADAINEQTDRFMAVDDDTQDQAREKFGELQRCAWRLTKEVFAAVDVCVPGVVAVRDSLNRWAELVCRHTKNAKGRIVEHDARPIEWETPLGLLVSQTSDNYYAAQARPQRVRYPGGQFNLRRVDRDHVDTTKQRQGFQPNFIHSLDACHLFMVVDECRKRDIPIATIHDCFHVHATNVDALNKIVRDTFIELHSSPILEMLRRDLIQRYDVDLPPTPEPSGEKLDLEAVRQAAYFIN